MPTDATPDASLSCPHCGCEDCRPVISTDTANGHAVTCDECAETLDVAALVAGALALAAAWQRVGRARDAVARAMAD